jgi:hypothetical protein
MELVRNRAAAVSRLLQFFLSQAAEIKGPDHRPDDIPRLIV